MATSSARGALLMPPKKSRGGAPTEPSSASRHRWLRDYCAACCSFVFRAWPIGRFQVRSCRYCQFCQAPFRLVCRRVLTKTLRTFVVLARRESRAHRSHGKHRSALLCSGASCQPKSYRRQDGPCSLSFSALACAVYIRRVCTTAIGHVANRLFSLRSARRTRIGSATRPFYLCWVRAIEQGRIRIAALSGRSFSSSAIVRQAHAH